MSRTQSQKLIDDDATKVILKSKLHSLNIMAKLDSEMKKNVVKSMFMKEGKVVER